MTLGAQATRELTCVTRFYLSQGFRREVVSDERVGRGHRERLSDAEEDPRQQQLDEVVGQPQADGGGVPDDEAVENDVLAVVDVRCSPHEESENHLVVFVFVFCCRKLVNTFVAHHVLVYMTGGNDTRCDVMEST